MEDEKDDRPEWVDETPEDMVYFLAMSNNGEHLQDIDLTRAEYVALKRYLAEHLGFAVAIGPCCSCGERAYCNRSNES